MLCPIYLAQVFSSSVLINQVLSVNEILCFHSDDSVDCGLLGHNAAQSFARIHNIKSEKLTICTFYLCSSLIVRNNISLIQLIRFPGLIYYASAG
jgi:hypothetical protein